MKKTSIFLLGLITLFVFSLEAKSNPPAGMPDVAKTFEQGDFVLNVGLGLGSTLYTGSYYTNSFPAISASVEYGVMDDIIVEKMTLGVGGIIGYSASKTKYSYFSEDYGWKYSYLTLGLRGAMHYPLVENFDVHAGVILGFNVISSNYYGDDTYASSYSAESSSPIAGAYIGGRYYFTPNIAAMAELGYGISVLNIGLAFKF
jgi:hypothetical protein